MFKGIALQGLDDLNRDDHKAVVIREPILDILLEAYIKAVQQGVTGATIIQAIIGVIKLALLFDGSLDVGLSELGVICEEIHHLGGISQILKVHNSVHSMS